MAIRELSSLLVGQIAAGEVIERPESVLKELLENSIDAKARHISVIIEEGGLKRIQVRDDGVGIPKEELALAVRNHATSKIRQFSDLERILSLGFRGEALASICAVSRFSVQSKPAEQASAWELSLTGGQAARQQACAHPNGTSIIVRDLFFNTPVRRTFLASARTEYYRIEQLVKHMALSRFDIAFEFQQGEKLIWRLAKATTPEEKQRRIEKLLGSAFVANSLYIDSESEDVRLSGWLGLPDMARSQNDAQYVYLNGPTCLR